MKKYIIFLLSVILGIILGYFSIYWISEVWLGDFLLSIFNNDPEPWQPPLIGALIWILFAILFGYLSNSTLKRISDFFFK